LTSTTTSSVPIGVSCINSSYVLLLNGSCVTRAEGQVMFKICVIISEFFFYCSNLVTMYW
jgi:hypothetical protein